MAGVGEEAEVKGRRHEEHAPAASVAIALATVVVLSLGGSLLANDVSEWVGHGLGHAVVGVPVAALAVFALRSWPPPRAATLNRAARRIVLAGFLGVAVGQLLEVVGARVDEPNAHPVEEVAHVAGQIVTMLSMLVLLAGAAAAAVAAARGGTVPKWLVVCVLTAAFVALLFLFVGAPMP